MNKTFRMLTGLSAGIVAAAAIGISAAAEDYEFDVSSASKTNGSWGQSYTVYTPLTGEEDHTGNFNPLWLTDDSEILVEYTYEGEANGSPLELIWQTWDGGPAGENPDIAGNWNKIAPYEFDDTSAKFSFADIAAAYGTDDFAAVYAINVGDTGVALTVTKMTATNVEITEAPAEDDGDAEEAAAAASGELTDYEFDVSPAIKTDGSWGQSYTVYTALTGEEDHVGNFNPLCLTEDSEILVEYTYEGEANGSPLELIWQTWDGGPAGTDPDVAGNWNKVAPYEYDETSAKFSFADIAAAYGTDNFATVYAINVGDTGVALTVTKMTATNVDMSKAVLPEAAENDEEEESSETEEAEAEEAEEEDAAEEEAPAEETEKETEAAETEVKETEAPKETSSAVITTVDLAANAPKEGGAGSVVLIVIIALVVVAAAVFVVMKLLKGNKGKYY